MPLVVGVGIEKEFPDGCIDRNIGQVPGSPIGGEWMTRGKQAVTHFKISGGVIGPNTLLELWLETGRTHQIRVHMNYAGYPVLGDKMYGTPSRLINRQALHAQ